MPVPDLQLTLPSAPVVLGSAKLQKRLLKQDAVEALGYLTVLGIALMFFFDGGWKIIHDVPTLLDSVSRLASLIGTGLMLVMLLLSSRVPWIDKVIGHDQALTAHKKLGKPALYLILTHFLASLIAYTVTDGQTVVAELIWMITNLEEGVKAFIALTAMIAVVVTSLTFARRRVKYETWFAVHLLAYVVVLFSLPHMLEIGSDLVNNEVNRWIWLFLYWFVGANIVWFRVLQPLILSAATQTKVSEITAASSNASSIFITGKRLDRYRAKAGQFFYVRFLTKGLAMQAHPFSLAAVPTGDALRFTIGGSGDASRRIQGLKPGTRVILEGPYGVFTEATRTKRKVLMIGAGLGLVPIRALAEGLSATPGDITILARVRDTKDAALLDELREIAELRGHRLELLAGRRPNLGRWITSKEPDLDALRRIAPDFADSDIYICGPLAMRDAAVETLTKAGVPSHQIHTEEYNW